MIINLPGYEAGIPDLTANTSLPVLQDTTKALVAESYNAEKWYMYLIDAQGYPQIIHYSLDLDTDGDRLLDEIASVVSGEAMRSRSGGCP